MVIDLRLAAFDERCFSNLTDSSGVDGEGTMARCRCSKSGCRWLPLMSLVEVGPCTPKAGLLINATEVEAQRFEKEEKGVAQLRITSSLLRTLLVDGL